MNIVSILSLSFLPPLRRELMVEQIDEHQAMRLILFAKQEKLQDRSIARSPDTLHRR